MKLRSLLKPETITILALGHIKGDIPITYTHVEKTTFLIERFFPNLNTDLSDITNQNFKEKQKQQRFELYRNIDIDKITQIIYQIETWKALKNDYLSTGFLKIYDRSLTTIITKITNTSFIYKYFPKYLYNTNIIILVKPNKSQKTKQILKIYRPIALLNTINKIIEITIYRYLSDITKEYKLLLKEQIGNKVIKSIKLAIRIITKTIYII